LISFLLQCFVLTAYQIIEHADRVSVLAVDWVFNDRVMELCSDARKLVQYTGVFITGPFYFGTASALLRYQSAYHNAVDEMTEQGVGDDDQGDVVVFVWQESRWLNLFYSCHGKIAYFCTGTILGLAK
jgi:hypothetical protein